MKKDDLEKNISKQIKEYEESIGLEVGWINVSRSNDVGFNSKNKNDINISIKINND